MRAPRINLTSSFLPLLLFVIGGLAIFAALYLEPPTPKIAAVAGFILMVFLVLFLFLYRTTDRVSIGAFFPAIVGPLLTNLYVYRRAPKTLVDLLDGGGDQLIQIAFFFASLFGAIAYMFVLFREEEGAHRSKKQILYVLFLVAVLLILVFWGLTEDVKHEGPPIFLDIRAPRVTILTLCRLALALQALVIALWPKQTLQEVSVASAGRGSTKRESRR